MNEPFRWPRLLFRVLAEDQWQRYYVAGYGSIALPTTPTTGQKCPVECWRPVNPYSSLCKLREQFIGQAVDLQKNDSTNSKMALIDLVTNILLDHTIQYPHKTLFLVQNIFENWNLGRI